MANYDVIVGNVGTVYSGSDEAEARSKFDSYVGVSRGRAAGEDVTLMRDGESIAEYVGLNARVERAEEELAGLKSFAEGARRVRDNPDEDSERRSAANKEYRELLPRISDLESAIELGKYVRDNPEGESLNEAGGIRGPGKFEGEALYVPFFYGIGLGGFADTNDDGDWVIGLTDADRAMVDELRWVASIVLHERDTGFVDCVEVELAPTRTIFEPSTEGAFQVVEDKRGERRLVGSYETRERAELHLMVPVAIDVEYKGCGPLPEFVTDALSVAGDVADKVARIAFADQWVSAVEEAHSKRGKELRASGEQYRVSDLATDDAPNLSGVEIMDVAPFDRMPPRFEQYGRDVVFEFVKACLGAEDGREVLATMENNWRAGGATQLAFMALGHGGDGRQLAHYIDPYVPRMDCDGRLGLDLSEVRELTDVPTDEEIRALCDAHPVGGRALDTTCVRDAFDAFEAGDRGWRGVMAFADAYFALQGMEWIGLPDGELWYANTGDTYKLTLTWDGSRFAVESWGGRVEAEEEKRTIETGEVRCAYCSEWGCEDHSEE